MGLSLHMTIFWLDLYKLCKKHISILLTSHFWRYYIWNHHPVTPEKLLKKYQLFQLSRKCTEASKYGYYSYFGNYREQKLGLCSVEEHFVKVVKNEKNKNKQRVALNCLQQQQLLNYISDSWIYSTDLNFKF